MACQRVLALTRQQFLEREQRPVPLAEGVPWQPGVQLLLPFLSAFFRCCEVRSSLSAGFHA